MSSVSNSNNPNTLAQLLFNGTGNTSGLVGNSASNLANGGISDNDSFDDMADGSLGSLSGNAPLPGSPQGFAQSGSSATLSQAMSELSQSGSSGILGIIVAAISIGSGQEGLSTMQEDGQEGQQGVEGQHGHHHHGGGVDEEGGDTGCVGTMTDPMMDSSSSLSNYDPTDDDGPSALDSLDSAFGGGDSSALSSILGSGTDSLSSGQQMQPFNLQQYQTY